MERQDKDLPYLLQYENVAWYEDGKVSILDRRVYPMEVKKVVCTHYAEVAKAIADMVTQSAGPYTAVGMGMALAAYESQDRQQEERKVFLDRASDVLSHARPTTANRMAIITKHCAKIGKDAIDAGKDPIEAIKNETIASLNRRYFIMEQVGRHLVEKIPDGGSVLTQCYGETIIGMMLRLLKEENKSVRFYCAETRPFYQGARLTASCCAEMGFETTVVTDNMIAWLLENREVSLFTSAADTITEAGYIANKVGTHQIAILCRHFHVPYYVTGIPDQGKTDRDSIVIEMRDPEEALKSLGTKITQTGVQGVYPSFDITPPDLITGIVTDKGTYKPDNLHTYFETPTSAFY